MNPQAADHLLDAVEETLPTLSEYAERYALVDDPILKAWGIRFVQIKNDLAFYTIAEDEGEGLHRALFVRKNKLELIGLLFQPQDIATGTIIIHIHGNYGNFYNNKFLWYMSKSYTQNGISFLTFNLSAHDGLCEGYRIGKLDYIGGGVADYNESISDIEAAIDYVRCLGYGNIFLQGHSLGCDKILEYIIGHKSSEMGVILLSPVDSYAVQKRWLSIHKNETVEEQINRLKMTKSTQNDGLEWLNIDEYGAEGLNGDWIYQIPVTKKTYSAF